MADPQNDPLAHLYSTFDHLYETHYEKPIETVAEPIVFKLFKDVVPISVEDEPDIPLPVAYEVTEEEEQFKLNAFASCITLCPDFEEYRWKDRVLHLPQKTRNLSKRQRLRRKRLTQGRYPYPFRK